MRNEMAPAEDMELVMERDEHAVVEVSQKVEKLVGGRARRITARVISWVATICIVLLVPGILLAVIGHNPFVVFYELAAGSVGGFRELMTSLDKSTGLIIAGLAGTVAFRAGIWNIGIQGQILMGGLGAVIGGLYLGEMATPLHLLITAILGIVGGAIWGLIPALLREKFRVNELVSSLLLNYIALYLIMYLVRWPLHGKTTVGPNTDTIVASAYIPAFSSQYALRISFIFAVLIGVVLLFVFRKTVFGYRINAIGGNPSAARLSGMNIGKVGIATMLVSGGIAGLVGWNEIGSTLHFMNEGIAINYGFYGVAAALIGRMRPMLVVIVAIAMGCVLTGGLFVQASMSISSELVLMLIAFFLLGLIMEPVIERKLQAAIARR